MKKYFLTPELFETLLSGEGERKSPRLFSDFYRDTNDRKLFKHGYSLRQRACDDDKEEESSYTLFSSERGVKEKTTIERVAELLEFSDSESLHMSDLVPSVEVGLSIKRYYFEGKCVDFVQWCCYGTSGMVALLSIKSSTLPFEFREAPEAHLIAMHDTGPWSYFEKKIFSSFPIIRTKNHTFSKYFSFKTIEDFIKELGSDEDERQLT